MGEQIYLGNMVFDITKTLRSYEYTKRSVVDLNREISSRQFDEMPSDTIFHYLQDQTEIVSFGDYLRRYIYEKTSPSEPFSQIPEEYYVSVIRDSFAMNRAPHAFIPVKTRWINIVKRWLNSNSVKRNTVFLLGFGLNMTNQEVSVFLTKVLKEQDFRFDDPKETAFWYCYHHGLPYSSAISLLEECMSPADMHTVGDAGAQVTTGNREIQTMTFEDGADLFWENVGDTLTLYLSNKTKIREYLKYLCRKGRSLEKQLFEEFEKLYERAVCAAKQVLPNNVESGDISVNIETLLCSGIPRTRSKNLSAMKNCTLSRQFEGKRISRQRISRILRREVQPERYDLITLLFLVYAIIVEPEWPTSRYMQFIDEINEILGRCRMMGIYPVNPYESFVLMCLLTEEPLATYNDVWELSYMEDMEI